ncbi:MAG: non-canonical purine NTP pyrophosphatase, partial [Staphylococcus sp.]|nr:non-canonical purine NTP pyrophosphatase [Staphylococcus sp.]
MFKGTVSGEITTERKGDHGFGYDPIFYLPEKNKTMAELTTEEKSDVSHRGNAIKALNEFLEREK